MNDRTYCMSSFLMFRSVINSGNSFSSNGFFDNKMTVKNAKKNIVYSADDLFSYLSNRVKQATSDGKAAIALSGGIDSAILASMMPKGSVAYTFRCVVPGIEVVDESPRAAIYASACGLEHRIIEITWEDIEASLPDLFASKGAPIHSIEAQILKASRVAKSEGFTKLIFGESADCLYGGLSNILSRDWTVGDFIERYSFVLPYKVLKKFCLITEPFIEFSKDGYIDVHGFYQNVFFQESTASYLNACRVGGIEPVLPYAETVMGIPLDYGRVRSGENKYLIREIFNKIFPQLCIPPKTPMPRPTSEWLKDWHGPLRDEFWPHCCDGMTGDQKWLVYCLEKYLNYKDE